VAIAAWFRLDDARERGEKYGNPYSGGSRRTAAQLMSVAKGWRSSLQLWLQFGPSAVVRTRSLSSIRARQPAYGTAVKYCEPDHDGLAVWPPAWPSTVLTLQRVGGRPWRGATFE
jgi:hypothetical protein